MVQRKVLGDQNALTSQTTSLPLSIYCICLTSTSATMQRLGFEEISSTSQKKACWNSSKEWNPEKLSAPKSRDRPIVIFRNRKSCLIDVKLFFISSAVVANVLKFCFSLHALSSFLLMNESKHPETKKENFHESA